MLDTANNPDLQHSQTMDDSDLEVRVVLNQIKTDCLYLTFYELCTNYQNSISHAKNSVSEEGCSLDILNYISEYISALNHSVSCCVLLCVCVFPQTCSVFPDKITSLGKHLSVRKRASEEQCKCVIISKTWSISFMLQKNFKQYIYWIFCRKNGIC